MKTETKHTPGPFVAYQDGPNWTIEVRDSDRNGGTPNLRSVIAILHDIGLCPEHGGTVAGNAKLFASAPALAAALDACMEALELLLVKDRAMADRFGEKWPLDLSPKHAVNHARAALDAARKARE